MNKKIFALLLAVVMVVSTLFVGCGAKVDNSDEMYDEQVENNDEQVENNDGPPPKEYKAPVDDTQYVRDGKFYLACYGRKNEYYRTWQTGRCRIWRKGTSFV